MPLRFTSLSFTRRFSLGSITERALRWLKPAPICVEVSRPRHELELQSLETRDLPGESLMALLWTHAGAAAFNLGGGSEAAMPERRMSAARLGETSGGTGQAYSLPVSNADNAQLDQGFSGIPGSRSRPSGGGFASAFDGGRGFRPFGSVFGNAYSLDLSLLPTVETVNNDDFQFSASANAERFAGSGPRTHVGSTAEMGDFGALGGGIGRSGGDGRSTLLGGANGGFVHADNGVSASGLGRTAPTIPTANAGSNRSAGNVGNSRSGGATNSPPVRTRLDNRLPVPQSVDAAVGDDSSVTIDSDDIGTRHLATPANVQIVDWNTGMTLDPAHTIPARVNQPMDLRAQVYGKALHATTPYSWSASSADVNYADGSSTYKYRFRFGTTFPGGHNDRTDHIVLTVEFSDNSTTAIDLYFHVVNISAHTGTTAYSLGRTEIQSPDQTQATADWIGGDNYSFSANTGELTTAHFLPEYSPSLPSFGLFYNSELASPKPIFLNRFDISSYTNSTKAQTTLSFNSSSAGTFYYSTSNLSPGSILNVAQQADASALSTGRYGWSVTNHVVRSSGSSPSPVYEGNLSVVNYAASPIGKGWGVAGLTRLYPNISVDPDPYPPWYYGVMIDNGDGTSLWFEQLGGDTFGSPAGDFSTLEMNLDDSFTRTMLDGTVIEYDAAGYQTSITDRVGNGYTFAYDTGKLDTITDPNGDVTDFDYSSGKLVTITDPASRVMTITHDGAKLSEIEYPDGSTWEFEYNADGRMTERLDPRAHTTTFAWDTFGRLDGIERADGSEISLDPYVEQGLLASGYGTSGSPATPVLLANAAATYLDGRDQEWQMRYDWTGFGHTTALSNDLDELTTWQIDSNGLMAAATDGVDRSTHLVRDSAGNVTKVIKPDLSQWNYTYNTNGQVLTAPNATNHTTTFDYDDGESGEGDTGVLLTVTNALTEQRVYTYRSDGVLETITDEGGKTTTILLDVNTDIDLPSGIEYADLSAVAFGYNAAGQIVSYTDENDNETLYSVQLSSNRVLSVTLPDMTPLDEEDALSIWVYGYDNRGNLHTVTVPDETPLTDEDNPVWTYDYDELNRLTVTTDPLEHTTENGYDDEGNRTTFTNGLTNTWTFGYDEANRLISELTPELQLTEYDLNAAGEVVMRTDPELLEWTYTYTTLGAVATMVDPTGFEWNYGYDTSGGGLLANGPRGDAYVYDDLGRVLTYTDPNNNTTEYAYDAGAYEVTVTDPDTTPGDTEDPRDVWTYTYDDRHRLETILTPEAITTTYGYDPKGNQTSITDGLTHTTDYDFDAQDHVEKITDAEEGETIFAYYPDGKLKSLTDPVANETSWTYDAAGRTTVETDPLLNDTTYGYDNANQLTSILDRLGRVRTFSYDTAGRLEHEYWYDNATDAATTPPSLATNGIHTIYDGDNRVTEISDTCSQYNFTYTVGTEEWLVDEDNAGTPDMPAIEFTRTYDPLMRDTSLTDNYAATRTYGYDAADNLTFAQLDVDGADIVPTVVLTYDPKERLSTITRQTDTEDGPGGPDWITVVTTMSYDKDNRVLGIVHDRNVNLAYDATLNDYAYEWDDGNRLSQEISIDDELPKIYGYDDTNQLTSVELNSVALETFHYDANGNRDMTGWHAGAGNRLEFDPTYSYDYDDEGNLITKTEKAGAEHVWTYSWDNRNRLVEVVETDDEAHVVADSKYTYDAYDRRIAMEVDPDGDGIAAPQKLWMAWDNGNLWADLVTDGETTTVLTNYLYGTALDQLFAKVSENGEDPRAVDWYLTDLIGSVRDIADAEDGEIVDHIKYTAFGEILDETDEPNANITQSNPHIGDRLKFASRECEPLTAMYANRARYYSPGTAQFISLDPISFAGLDINLARYCQNVPTSSTDPTGKKVYRVARDLDTIGTFGIGNHHYIGIIPDDLDGFKSRHPNVPLVDFGNGNIGFTLGAHKVAGQLRLIPNQTADVTALGEHFGGTDTPWYKSDFDAELHEIQPKRSVGGRTIKSDAEFIDDLICHGDEYEMNGGVEYDAFGTNCVAWVNGLLVATGMEQFDVSETADFWGVDIGIGDFTLTGEFHYPRDK